MEMCGINFGTEEVYRLNKSLMALAVRTKAK